MKKKSVRPKLEDVERFLDTLDLERQVSRWLLEDLANVEDSPELDEVIAQRLKTH